MSEDVAMAINELYASMNVDVDDWEAYEVDWESAADPPGYRRYSQTDGPRSTVVTVSEALASDPDFPLEQFLRREFAERLAHQRAIEAEGSP